MACTSEISRPTPRPTSMTGPETLTRTQIASRARSMTSVGLMKSGSNPSDRHLDDVLIGGDDLVADSHHRVQGDLRIGHCRGDVGEVALFLDRLHGELLGSGGSADGLAGGLRNHVGKAHAGGFGAAAALCATAVER